jgi:hypothetical protein
MKMYGKYSYSTTASPFLFNISEIARHSEKSIAHAIFASLFPTTALLHYSLGDLSVRLVQCMIKVSYIFNILRKIFEVSDTCNVLPSQMHGEYVCGVCLRTVRFKWKIWHQRHHFTLPRLVQEADSQTPSCSTIAIAWLFSPSDSSN